MSNYYEEEIARLTKQYDDARIQGNKKKKKEIKEKITELRRAHKQEHRAAVRAQNESASDSF